MAISREQLTGVGFLVTLTVRESAWSPDDGPAFNRARRLWRQRVQRLGAIYGTDVIELQRNGSPHIHALVFFPDGTDAGVLREQLVAHWLDVSSAWHTLDVAQDVRLVGDPGIGLWRYLVKHSGRSVWHYQRGRPMPAGIGRVTGTWGDWPTFEEERELSWPAWFALRRALRRWAVDDARRRGDLVAEVAAGRMLELRCSPEVEVEQRRFLSSRIGLKRWGPRDTMQRLVDWSSALHPTDSVCAAEWAARLEARRKAPTSGVAGANDGAARRALSRSGEVARPARAPIRAERRARSSAIA